MRDLCQQHGFALFAIHGRFLASLAGARLAPAAEAVALIGEAIQALDSLRQDHRQELHLPELLGWLVEASAACGMISEARGLLDEAFEIGQRIGERLGKADLFRLLGEEGRSEDAAELVSGVVERFEEGAETVDLRAAVDLTARLVLP